MAAKRKRCEKEVQLPCCTASEQATLKTNKEIFLLLKLDDYIAIPNKEVQGFT